MSTQVTKDSRFDILKKDANVYTLIKDHLDETWVLLQMYQGSVIIKTFNFCSKYRGNSFKEITHPIDTVRLTNFYNDFFDDLDDGTLVQIIHLADYLMIDQLLQLICYKLSYKLRDMNPKERFQFFQLTIPEDEFSAEL